MGFSYTKEQQQVIDSRGCNLLVSAAAGSGKTAVLVERIVKMVSDKARPVDIDRLLIVTFTNAAAAQMRERISDVLSRRLEEEPDNSHLQRQLTLLHNARITTIDSFCLFVIRNNFNDIGLDPGFRVADEGELKLLRGDVMAELTEDHFAGEDEEFLQCVESFGQNGDEKPLTEHIQRLYDFSRSHPFPKRWLREAAESYVPESEGRQENDWLMFAAADLKRLLHACILCLEEAISVCEQSDGPYMYLPLLEAERDMLRAGLEMETFAEYEKYFSGMAFGRLPSKKDAGVSSEKRELVKGMRTRVKEALEKAAGRYFFLPMEQALADMEQSAAVVRKLVELTLEFGERLAGAKQKKNVVDFGDIEHYALQIMLEETKDGYQPTKAAREYRNFFHEIMIDEYQDSNLVQEFLLQSISGEDEGRYNRFMVGDVKQSIYKFRLARPEIFMEKMERYTVDGKERKISLHQNFRSRREVTDAVNYVFSRIMGKELGGIPYDEEAALYPGATYPEYEGAGAELLLLARDEEDKASAAQQEAVLIAERIRRLKESHQVLDEENGGMRPVRYGDIAVLLRSSTGFEEVLPAVLRRYGIPAHTASSTGYFSSEEIRVMLHFLRVLDNPMQDIPLFGVMHSLIGAFTDSDIAWLRAKSEDVSLYEALQKAVAPGYEETSAEGKEKAAKPGGGDMPEELIRKARRLLDLIDRYREKTVYEPVKQLLREILAETGYMQYMTAYPEGHTRRANLEMLLLRAAAFEKTGSHGLFAFIRYMEQLEKYEVDYGEAGTVDEHADVVRIMSIHKSKGLEFPVCIVAGLAKRFHTQDQSGSLLMDVDLGLGCEYVNTKMRFRRTTLRRNILARKLHLDNLGEELRILYVAMTRAREKLILTGCVREPEKKLTSQAISYLTLSTAGSLLDFLLPAWNGIRVVQPGELKADDIGTMVQDTWRRQRLLEYEKEDYSTDWQSRFRERFAYQYPLQPGLYTKTTVSELKMEKMTDASEGSNPMFSGGEKAEAAEAYVPRFCGRAKELSGAARGSAFHRVMELLDFSVISPDGSQREMTDMVDQRLQEFIQCGTMTEQEAACVDSGKIADFLLTAAAARMTLAAREGNLKKEQPFILGLAANLVRPDFPPEETVLIQGIIDVYWEEDGELVVLDYKTDRVRQGQELVTRYRLQLDYYAQALARITGKPVREKLIYSFYLNEVLPCV